jgi:uncharacterized damage-inducible protein DinB
MSESGRIWDLLQRSYEGDVWHGPAFKELVEGVTAEQAVARPVPAAKTIWEILRHVMVIEDVVRLRLMGEPIGELRHEQSWPAVSDTSPAAWRRDREAFERGHVHLREALWGFPDGRMNDVVPGRDYPFYVMLHGVVQHTLYHAGQIVVLMQALGLEPRG